VFCFLGIFVDAANTLNADIKNEANDLGSLGQYGSSLDHIFVIKLGCCRVIMQLKNTLHEPEIIILKLQKAREHVHEVLLVLRLLFLASLIRCSTVTFLLDNSCSVVEWPSRNKAFLPSSSHYIKYKTIRRKLLSTLDPQNIANLDVSPGNGNPPLDSPCDHQPLNLLTINNIRYTPLSKFK